MKNHNIIYQNCFYKFPELLSAIFLVLFLIFNCKSPSLGNPCDTKSSDFLRKKLLGSLIGESSVYCGSRTLINQNIVMSSFSIVSPNTIAGTISDTNITITVAYSNVTSLVAGFAHNGVSANIAGVTQVSGVTVNDFSSPKIYTIIGNDNTTKNYTVTVVKLASPSLTATRVYGQSGSFTSGTANYLGISANSLRIPFKTAIDSTGVYIADQENNRTLYYPGTSTTATRVYGQAGLFTTATTGTVSSTSFYGIPDANVPEVATDSTGVYISDIYGSRVLYFPGTSTTATRIYGQSGNFSTTTIALGTDGLRNPQGVVIDTTGVYIVDTFNNRVLFYPGTSTTATRVYGQNGSFATDLPNNGGVSANSLSEPRGIDVDLDGVYIADIANNRVLFYPGTSTTATRVYGQNGNFTTANTGTSANAFNSPWFVKSFAGKVFISDRINHRVLSYEGTSTTATSVWGQAGSFVSSSLNNGGLSATSLSNPYGIEVDLSGLYVTDSGNHRVLFFPR
ncbi:NHL repeat-containing protein [Leptospira sp. 'Mane']|uniref:NHL repeat-containing protein n=1 Tax=Leptospira sp. 'Mane' TaxID=3387407 RepID=UPI00398B5F06